jgi:hypothetical protein
MEKIDKKIKEKYNGEYERISGYIDNETYIELEHVCGNKFSVKPHEFFRNNTSGMCPYCHSSKNMTKDIFQWKLDHEYEHTKKNGYEVLEFNGMNNKSVIKHTCGNIWTPEPRIIKQGKGCPVCSHRSYGYDSEYVKKEISALTNGEYVVLSDYEKENIPIKVKHVSCGTEFFPTRRNFIYRHTRCPECYRKENRSKGVQIIERIFNKNKVVYNIESLFEECRNERLLPFDFKIENILIEYDGEQHFFKRRDDYGGFKLLETKTHDQIKNNFVMNSKELSMIRIPYTVSFQKLQTIIEEISNNLKQNKTDILSATTIEQNNLLYIKNNIDISYYTNIDITYFSYLVE